MSAIVVGSFVFPVPSTNIELFWVLLGMQFGRSFGKKLDQGIQAGDTFKSLPVWVKGIVKRLLDFTHHWWIGGFLWLYPDYFGTKIGLSMWILEITFFGFGLMIDDLRDIENLKRRFNGEEETNPQT